MCHINNFTELIQWLKLCDSRMPYVIPDFFYYFGGSLVQDQYSIITQIIVHQRIAKKFG